MNNFRMARVLAFAAIGAATSVLAADIVLTPPAGGGVSITDSTGASSRLRVDADGSVSVTGLAGAGSQPSPVCFNSASGRLGTCGVGTVQGQVSACTRTLIYIAGRGFVTYLPGSGTNTPAIGNFSFDRVPTGLYNLVAENGSATQTAVVSVSDLGVTTVPAIQFPCGTLGVGLVTVNFSVDDRANHVYQQGDLQWKGSFAMAGDFATSRKISFDGTWAGPWPVLYDDGPSTLGGHEPVGSTAGDHIWGLTVFVTPPTTGTDQYSYGLIDTSSPYNGAWLWLGNNGTFDIASSQNTAVPINAQGLTFAAFGTTDIQVTLDINNLAAGAWNTSTVELKTSQTNFVPHALANDGSGHYTFTLSNFAGAGKPFPHTGLARSAEHPEFVFVLGGSEYKNNSGTANTQGVSAGTKAAGAGSFTPATLQTNLVSNNTYIVIP